MTNRTPILILILAGVAVLAWAGVLCAQAEPPASEVIRSQDIESFREGGTPRQIRFDGAATMTMHEKLAQKITLDVREMSVIDVLKFLALKGDVNMVTPGNIQGRATFYLKSVSIQDALDIAVISNRLAYVIEKDIIRIMNEAEYAAAYGKKFNDNSVVEIVQLHYAKPNYVLSTLEGLKSSLGRLIIDEDTGSVVMIDTPDSVAQMKKTIAELETPLVPVVYTLQYAKAEVVAEKLRARIDANAVGSITVDERSNQLIVRALPGRRDEVLQLIKDLDTPTREVLVEARVLQVVFKPQQDFGIDWKLDFRTSDYNLLRQVSFENIMLDRDNLSSSNNLYQNFGQFAVGNFSVNKFEMAIRALKQVSNTKILSNPKILVTNNQEAKIHVGDTVPYIISTTSGTGDNAITSEDVQFVDVGLKLNVIPTSNEDGFVTMVLNPEISTVVGSISSQGGGIPQVNKTSVETTVMVKDGMTIVLGGLKKENKIQVKKGVPLLMNIPGLRWLFSSESESIEATEIVIFITPHIVTGDEVHDEYRGDIKPFKEYTQDESGAASGPRLKIKD